MRKWRRQKSGATEKIARAGWAVRHDKAQTGWYVGDHDGERLDVKETDSRCEVYTYDKATRRLSRNPGMVYEFEYEEKDGNTSIYPASASYKGLWENEDERTEWQSLADVYDAHKSFVKKEKDGKTDDSILECLKPLRYAYGWLRTRKDKSLFLTQVMLRIQQGIR